MNEDVRIIVKTVSGPTYTSINLTKDQEVVQFAIKLVKEKDKMDWGHLSFWTDKGVYLTLPLSDVAHIGVRGATKEWLTEDV